MATYTPEQQQVVKAILKVARRKNASPKEVKAAIETGLVESGLRNLPGGDADSAGWRQERASLYPDPTNVEHAASRFFDEAKQANRSGRYGSAGSLAAAVQRPAAQYRGRYQQRSGDAEALLAGYGGGGPGAAPSSIVTTTTTTPGVDNSGMRRQLVSDFLQQGGVKSSQASAAFASGIQGAQDVAATSKTTRTNGRLDPETASVHGVQAVQDRADRLNADKRPYVWGGGHGGDSWGLDCSGAVSEALGVDVRVASEFKKFGKSGPGKDVSIYASADHVLMRVRDPKTGSWHWWGTSHSNPEGGPGWIPAAAVPASYLKKFEVRHPNGM